MTTFNNIDTLTIGSILKYLLLIDLCRIARMNTHLREAARIEFTRRYQNKRIKLILIEITPEYQDERGTEIKIYGFKHSLFMLRCFGDLIANLSFDLIDTSTHKEILIAKYLNDYCFKTLNSIYLSNIQFELLENLCKPLPGVREITFIGCTFNNSLLHIRLWFPNLTIVCFHGRNSIKYAENNAMDIYANLSASNTHFYNFVQLNPEIQTFIN